MMYKSIHIFNLFFYMCFLLRFLNMFVSKALITMCLPFTEQTETLFGFPGLALLHFFMIQPSQQRM